MFRALLYVCTFINSRSSNETSQSHCRKLHWRLSAMKHPNTAGTTNKLRYTCTKSYTYTHTYTMTWPEVLHIFFLIICRCSTYWTPLVLLQTIWCKTLLLQRHEDIFYQAHCLLICKRLASQSSFCSGPSTWINRCVSTKSLWQCASL